MKNSSHLRLVSTFSNEAYPYTLFQRLEDPWDSTELQTAKMLFRGNALVAGVTDYRLFEFPDRVTMHVRTIRDWNNIIVARQPAESALFATQYDESVSDSLIKRRANLMQKKLDALFPGDITISVDTSDKSIWLEATSKQAYFKADKLSPMHFILFGRAWNTPSKAERNSPPTPGRSPGQPG